MLQLVQVEFSVSLLSRRCADVLVRLQHQSTLSGSGEPALVKIPVLVSTITCGDAPTSSEKYLSL